MSKGTRQRQWPFGPDRGIMSPGATTTNGRQERLRLHRSFNITVSHVQAARTHDTDAWRRINLRIIALRTRIEVRERAFQAYFNGFRSTDPLEPLPEVEDEPSYTIRRQGSFHVGVF